MVSLPVACLFSLASHVLGGPPELPRTSEARMDGTYQERSSKPTFRYIRDHGLVKNATLENEATFFDRLEREKKLEEIRVELEASLSTQKLVSLKLGPSDVQLLVQFDQSASRCLDQLGEAYKYLEAAQRELHQYHEQATPVAIAIAQGKLEAISLTSRIRRSVRSTDRLFRSSQAMLEGASRKLDDAHQAVAMSLKDLKDDDARRPDLNECSKAIETASSELTQALDQVKAIQVTLETVHREYLPDCSVPTGNSGPGFPSAAGGSSHGNSRDCQGASLEILNKSTPAMELLAQVVTDYEKVEEGIERARSASDTAVKFSEKADAVTNPSGEKFRQLQAESNQILIQAGDELSEIGKSLIKDEPAETSRCACCGDIVIRTRRPIDPACVCARTAAEMLEVEASIRKAQTLVMEMDQILQDKTKTREFSRAELELETTADRLKRALARGEEFRNQQFDQYPGDSVPLAVGAAMSRDFPPMVATYVARETWHYPLYFEDISLERYGLNHGCVQPIVSYGKFLADLALLPYNVCLDPPCTVQFDLGMYRPGDDVPHLIYLPRPDCKAALFEAAVWTGLMFTP